MESTNKSAGAKRKVCVILVDRANYGRLKPVMQAIKDQPDLELQVLAAGTMVLERFDMPVKVVEKDGFPISGQIYVELEGSNPTTMAKSLGFGVVEFASEFRRLEPDLVLIIGDRYEALAATMAAAYMNLCIAHIQGGEVSGSIDESARHAISKFSHFHFPSTQRAADYLIQMGEQAETILTVGCPSSDIARELERTSTHELINGMGSGATIDTEKPYGLVIFHPTTTTYGGEREQMDALLEALGRVAMPTILLWPNIDAGSGHVNKAIRSFRETHRPDWMRALINLMPEDYLRVLSGAACAIGNSSSFVRDASFFGTPVVLVGDRQDGREIDQHVTPVRPTADAVEAAIRAQLENGRYPASTLYGDGYVSTRIADAIAKLEPYVQKRLDYVARERAAAKAAAEESESCAS
ncbi:MAG: UDP-N-acetylglucosamine 2-epimerase [Rubripirellula sp.]